MITHDPCPAVNFIWILSVKRIFPEYVTIGPIMTIPTSPFEQTCNVASSVNTTVFIKLDLGWTSQSFVLKILLACRNHLLAALEHFVFCKHNISLFLR